MTDEPKLPDENQDDTNLEAPDEKLLKAEHIETSSEDTLDKISSKIEAIEASADVIDEINLDGPTEIIGESDLETASRYAEIEVDEEPIDDGSEAETEVDIAVEKLMPKPAMPAPKTPPVPEWKRHLQEEREREAAAKKAAIEERRAYEASIRAEKEAERAARREEINQQQAVFRQEWEAKQAEREAAKNAMIEKVREERERKEREMEAQLHGDGFTYPKPEAKTPYPKPSSLKDEAPKAESKPEAKTPYPKPSSVKAEVPKAESKPEIKAEPKAAKTAEKTASKNKKASTPPAPAAEKKETDELSERINRLSKPEE